jgi:carbamoyltransferase
MFFNSALNSRVKMEAGFQRVFVPINPGDAGVAVGAALHAAECLRRDVSPFCGPGFSSDSVKATLDNCKLTYDWVSERERVQVAVEALLRGWTVAWYEGRMEWGARALGGRSILASPFAPYVLDNLNRFLKQREPWRGYALSTPATALTKYFDGPEASPYMECDFRPRDLERFARVLPGPDAAVRVQTVTESAPKVFRALLEQFGQASGLPVLVNTSFNAFREPIACTPRDAIRIFYGTGVDLLVLDEFVLRK